LATSLAGEKPLGIVVAIPTSPFFAIKFMLGIFALLVGISTPGYGAEVFGVIAILLSLIGSGFSISTLSIIFIIIGCLLLVVEIFVIPGFGAVGVGGIICLIIGSIFLLPNYPTRKWLISGEYMADALPYYKNEQFTVPPDIVWAIVDRQNGLLCSSKSSRAVKLPYIKGSEPVQFSQRDGSSNSFQEFIGSLRYLLL
jgi:hypothetical protein